MDPQANASSGVGIAPGSVQRTIYDALIGEAQLSDVIRPTGIKTLSVVPSSQHLTAVEYELFESGDRGTHLRRILADLDQNAYEYIVIDSPPSLGVLTLNVLTAAQRVIVPLQPEYYALEGITYLMATIDRVKRTLNPGLTVEGLVLTMWDPHQALHGEPRVERGGPGADHVGSAQSPRARSGERGAATFPRLRRHHPAQREAQRGPLSRAARAALRRAV